VNAGGVIRDNLVRNVGFGTPTLPVDPNTNEPLYQGDPIVVVNFEASPRTVTIEDNWIVNYNDIGIVVGTVADPNAPAVETLTAHVLNNTVIGMGPNDVIDQWGMSIFSDGSEDPQFFPTGTIRGNRVRDMITLEPFPFPTIGIFTNGIHNMQLSENVVENVNIGIVAPRSFQVQFVENKLVGPRGAAGVSGLELAGNEIQVIENSFRQFGIGIFLFVEDGFFGSALNTSLDENHFEKVGTDVLTGPGASGLALASAASGAQASSRLQRYRLVQQP
jgi:hypothetical protein